MWIRRNGRLRLLFGYKSIETDLQSTSSSARSDPLSDLSDKGSMFRRKNTSLLSNKVCLGELVDMFHNREATRVHDKVYALLGMSEHILRKAGLLPDYTVPWEFLMQRLVKFALTEEALVKTCNDKELAVIETEGYVFGRVGWLVGWYSFYVW
jgi:hypothetical protein